ncbi:hypothetical protein ACF09Y_26320 [Streptomyces massasporeus]|uniref:hypothetical protein n=1 Tax=Streptomyces TaxID=1883 RepID=UPI0021AB3A9D|nr:hypothetical protein [Streptomyces sp. WAC04114]
MSGKNERWHVASPRSNTADPDRWSVYEWVVWQIEVDDPERRISEPYHSAGEPFLLAKNSREVMVDFAERLGCIYEGCRDDGVCGSDDDPCYTWWFRVPQSLHVQRNPRGWPLVMKECQLHLNRLFADHYHWQVFVDARRTQAIMEGNPLPPLP